MNNWYALYTIAGKENKAKEMLQRRAVLSNKWKDTVFEILVPTEKEYTSRFGKRKIVDKKIFPGYIFVKMFLDEETEKIVKGTEGIKGFVMSGSRPLPLSQQEIANILLATEENPDGQPKSDFKINDIILVTKGPFSDLAGKVESVDLAKGKVKAYITIFGRETLVELNTQDISINI